MQSYYHQGKKEQDKQSWHKHHFLKFLLLQYSQKWSRSCLSTNFAAINDPNFSFYFYFCDCYIFSTKTTYHSLKTCDVFCRYVMTNFIFDSGGLKLKKQACSKQKECVFECHMLFLFEPFARCISNVILR